MEQKTLKDLRWFLVKDLELYNKPIPKNKRSLWDLVAFDVETDEGAYTLVKSWDALIFYPNDKDKRAFFIWNKNIENFEKLPIPIALNTEMIFSSDQNCYNENWRSCPAHKISIKQMSFELLNNEF